MKEKLKKLILKEDKKNPLTDEECAKQLMSSRTEVTRIRKSLGIPDSWERRKSVLSADIKKILDNSPEISERRLTDELKNRGFEISRFSVSNMLRELNIPKDSMNPKNHQKDELLNTHHDYIQDSFSNMIGWDKSMRVKVEQAKAAILYPPNGLHTLIQGATGVGKSELAECMYKFAQQAKKLDPKEFPFIVFDCADYAENPQLLLAQLFGYRKGAFTGADTDKDGLVASANGGILFLDEVHRLPPDGQEILFQLIDKGKYRKLGETNTVHEAKVMIIAATSEDIEKNLLATFRRRIPMVIELLPLSVRPVEERLEIIKMFFNQEAARINKKIEVDHSTLRTLLVYNCIGNIGQLRSDIQVACARGFLNYVTKGNETKSIMIDFSTLPAHVTNGLMSTKWNREEIEKYISDDLTFFPDVFDIEEIRDSFYTLPNEIYKNIEEEYTKLQRQGLSDEVINRIIGDYLDTKVKKVIRQMEKNKHKLITRDIKTIVRPEIVDLVLEMIKVAKVGLGEINDTLFYCLTTHLNASVERIESGRHINNPHLDNVKKDYPKEYETAKSMASLTNGYLGFELPEEEVGFIAMYLRTLVSMRVNPKETIGIVVLSHGHVAEGMSDVANHLLGVDLVKAVEMSLDEMPEEAYKRTLEAVINVDHGRGVLLLADMGSLIGFGSQITQMTGINTRTVTRVDTIMVMDAIRKVLLPEADLNDVADSLIKGKEIKVLACEDTLYHSPDKFAIISLCLTGEGTAVRIETMIRDKLSEINKDIKIITMGAIDEEDIVKQIDKVHKNMKLLVIVGTVDPRYPEVPFVSAAEVLKQGGIDRFAEVVRNRLGNNRIEPELGNMVFDKELILINRKVRDKTEALNILANQLVQKGRVTKNFINEVLEREKFGTTAIGTSLAIPHGYGEEIISPAIGIMTLKNPVEWYEGCSISMIFMLAVNEKSANEFQKLYKIIKNQEAIKKIKLAKSPGAIMQIINSV